MKITVKLLKKMLVDPGHISEADFDLLAKESKDNKKKLEDILVTKGLITNNQLGKLIAEELGMLFVDLEKVKVDETVLRIIPEIVAKNQKVMSFDRTKQGLKVAIADPDNLEMIEWLRRKTGEDIISYYATPKGLNGAMKYYKKELKATFEEIIKEQTQVVKKGTVGAEDVPVIKIVDTIVQYAYENGASDIHIEPLSQKTQIRFRIDSILHNVLMLPKDIHGLIVTRIKVLSKMRTDEHFSAQDGKFSGKFEKDKFDIRVSIVPVTEGEKVVMRLLSERARKFDLESLGFLGNNLKIIKSVIKRPYGMILTTGPTGSGKTTTLYAILKILNKPEVNIATIEDPVEYDVEGANQIQVNEKTNLTFAKGLRSIVRQDPDIIMVGEVRDEETAGIAINSAMTGHLVLSTMHANTAATNIPRLMDMGVEPFLISSSVNIIIAQRLVRKICMKCRQSYIISGSQLKTFKKHIGERVWTKFFAKAKSSGIRGYRSEGCRACNGTGYQGRIGIFEVLEMNESIKELIMSKANADKIQAQAIEKGMATMLEDGVNKVLSGATTVDELLRVTKSQ